MNISRGKRRAPIVPINSMSDIAFLLLIFIMLISLMNYRKEIQISYPEAEYQEVTQADKNLEIWIDYSGIIYHEGQVINYADAEAIIADAVVSDPDIRIHILADKNTPYKYINDLIEVLKLLQHRVVSFVVKEARS